QVGDADHGDLCGVCACARADAWHARSRQAGSECDERLGFMWNPSWPALLETKTWLAAAGQIFFTLGVGFGIIINYSSYLRRKDDIVLSGLTASAVNEFFEVCLGGLITI